MTKLRDTLVATAHLIADAIESAATISTSPSGNRRRRRGPRPAQILLPVSELDRKRAQRELERLGYGPLKNR